jgi:lipopolysaccharide transport system ATP-binding protein
MNKPIIKVKNLSKRYRIGLKEELHDTFFGALLSWVKYPLFNFKRLQKLSKFNESDESDDIIWALRDISFEVNKGEVLGVVGKNGAGKSTLLKILSRITEPTGGWAKANGRVASLLEVGTGFHQELTGRENVFLNGAILGMKKEEIERKFDEIVDFSGVGKFIDTPVKRYSSGMTVRLAFSVAAHLEPEIMIIDEVLAVGDVEFQKKCLGKMKDITSEGRTVIFVSHNMPSVIKLCDRAILIKNGKIEQEGKAIDVVADYLSDFESGNGEVIWEDFEEAPGNDNVRLLSVRILQEGFDGPIQVVDRCKEIQIEITYINLQEEMPLYSGIRIRDSLGTNILHTSNHSANNILEDKWFINPQAKGRYKSVCRIPANLLIEGQYRITPFIGIQPKNAQAGAEDVISFRTYDSRDENRRTLGGWWGVVGPQMEWVTDRLDP